MTAGGTRQVGNGEQANSDADMEGIMERCCRLLPALREAEVVKAWAGLRPGRPCVRLDAEVVRSPETGREMRVVHCYGHGGSGVTLAWGCAADIVGHVEEMLC